VSSCNEPTTQSAGGSYARSLALVPPSSVTGYGEEFVMATPRNVNPPVGPAATKGARALEAFAYDYPEGESQQVFGN